MTTNFDQPQKQSPVGVLVMFADTLQEYARAFLPVLAITLFKAKEFSMLYFVLILVVALLFIGVIAYLRFINFTFYLDSKNQEFVIQEGILSKTKTTVQLHKIQQVNITQSLIQRVIGVYGLEVDTAGSNSKEGKIKAISHNLALALKSELLNNQKAAVAHIEEAQNNLISETENQLFIRIGLPSLIKVGITSNYVKSFSLLLVFFFTMLDYLQKILGEQVWDSNRYDHLVEGRSIAMALFFLVAFVFFMVVVINLARTIIRYFNYKITRQKGSLLLSFGLINTKSTILKPEKVQILSITQNYFQKKLDVLQLQIKQTAHSEHEEKNTHIEIPGCNAAEKDAILNLLYQKNPQKGVMLRPNFRKFGFAVFLTVVLPLVGYFLFRQYQNPGSMFDFAVFIYVIFVGLIQYFKYRNHRLFVHDDFIIKQSGAWDIAHEIIEPGKIQGIAISQLFWHKSIGIGSLILYTAGGNIRLDLGQMNLIQPYVNKWLYELEKTDVNWM